jgi:hypothetical protein
MHQFFHFLSLCMKKRINSITRWTVLTVSRFQNEMRYKVRRLFQFFFLAFRHACSLKKCFSCKKIMISFSTAAMGVTRVLILKLHKKGKKIIDIFRKLKHLNVNNRFIERTLKKYKFSPRRKLRGCAQGRPIGA